MYRKRRIKNKSNKKFSLKIIILLIILIFLWSSYSLYSDRGINYEKISLIQPTSRGDISILVIDYKLKQFDEIVIPANTELEVSGNLGKRKVSTLWKLGEDEDREGELVANTISSNFLIPIDGWSEKVIYDPSYSFSRNAKFVLDGSSSGFNLIDRSKIVSFLVNNRKPKSSINLNDTSALKNANVDGEERYVFEGTIPDKILSYFVDPNFSENTYKIMIRRSLENSDHSEKIGKIVETLGVKPAFVSLDYRDKDSTCVVKSVDQFLLRKLSTIFSCRAQTQTLNGFDAEIIIGDEYFKIF